MKKKAQVFSDKKTKYGCRAALILLRFFDLIPTEDRNDAFTAAEGALDIIQQAANTVGLKIVEDYYTSVK